MPNLLTDLSIEEVSLVDVPANSSIDPVTGKRRRHAVVALFKRDSADNQSNKEYRNMEFEQILKSAKTREEVVSLVKQKAQERVAKKGGSGKMAEAAAEAKVWEDHPEAIAKYESLPKATGIKPQETLVAITKAEGILDARARKIMKRDGISYPQACSQVLTEDPSLYTRYCNELSSGETYQVPESITKGGTTKRSVGIGGLPPVIDDQEDEDEDELDEEEIEEITREKAKKAIQKKIAEIAALKAQIVKMERNPKTTYYR